MHPFRSPLHLFVATSVALSALAYAADSTPPASGSDVASRLSALQQDGSSYVRLRMEIDGPAKQILQVQIKQRRTKTSSEVVYQVLFPKERKGESVLLRQTDGHVATGFVFTPPSTVRPISDLKDSLLGSALSYEDAIENFFAWPQQAFVGAEDVSGVKCQILESKPGKGAHSIYASVRSWIDPQRLVPMRIEKYSSPGQVARRIDTTRVVDDGDNHIPANLSVSGGRADASTQINGSRIKHDVTFTDAEFTPEGFKEVTIPHGSPE